MSAALRYAKALFQLAESASQISVVAQAVTALQAAVADVEIAQALANPRLTAAQRAKFAQSLAKAVKAPSLLADTLGVLAEHNRLALVADVFKAFQVQADAATGTMRVQVQSSQALTEEQRRQVIALMKSHLKSKEVVIEETVQPDLIGGFRAFFGGQVWDSSLSGSLARLKNQFTQRLNQPK